MAVHWVEAEAIACTGTQHVNVRFYDAKGEWAGASRVGELNYVYFKHEQLIDRVFSESLEYNVGD